MPNGLPNKSNILRGAFSAEALVFFVGPPRSITHHSRHIGDAHLYSVPGLTTIRQGGRADDNLADLAAFVYTLFSSSLPSLVTLRLDGSAFENERPRIQRALANSIKSSANSRTE